MKKHLFNFILVLFLAFGVSCATNRPFVQSGLITEKTETITSDQVYSILTTNGIHTFRLVIADKKYVLVTKEWIENKFAPSLWNFYTEFDGLYWKYESWDCDEYSRAAHFFASVLHYKSKTDPTSGLAFGEIHYNKENNVGHAANLFIYKEGTNYLVGFFEPQKQKIYQLSPSEKLITYYIGF